MLEQLVLFFYGLFDTEMPTTNFLSDYSISTEALGLNGPSNTIELPLYLSTICAYVSLIVIIVLCCLFIGKIIKTIGRLFSGGTL